jgi:uroporphyrinogen III methyltransferase/synthase
LNKGVVYLVGAGPGDPGLITVKGLEMLRQADVVVYDRLAWPALLDQAPAGAVLVDAGKGPDRHKMTQDAINTALAEHAEAGHTVVRLKGGDPFVFGRGGEEAEYLAQRGIPFEVVPGVTAAVAVPAYAGIPVTHRRVSSSLAIVTGNEDPAKEDTAVDWDKLAGAGTLVLMMGMANLEGIAARLIQAGRSPQTPVALVRWGTCPGQRTLVGTLETIPSLAAGQGFANPVVTIVGEVVNLREKLAWREKKPLFGRRVLVTRAREEAGRLAALVAAQGGEAYEFPAIAVEAMPDTADLDRAVRELGSYQWAVFTSANGVRFFWERLDAAGLDARALAGVKLAAIGSRTAATLGRFGLSCDLTPEEFRAEAVLSALVDRVAPGERVLCPRAAQAREVLVQGLREAGVFVAEVAAYRTVPGGDDPGAVRERLARGEIDAVTFTSSSTVHNLVRALGGEAAELLGGTTLAAIGPVTAQTLAEYGLSCAVTAARYTVEGLVEALATYFKRLSG